MKTLKRIFLFFPFINRIIRAVFSKNHGNSYPSAQAGELSAIADVLLTPSWNMAYGNKLAHNDLEKNFAAYIGSEYAVAVSSGGMGIQMCLRGLGLGPGHEVIHQADTCVANSFSILNAGCVPIFSDVNKETFLADTDHVAQLISPQTRALMPIHMWGNGENMQEFISLAKQKNLQLIEDCCLGIGTLYDRKKTGTFGNASVFSFGCIKPIQAGEGGIICTNDKALAKELRVIRNYGDMNSEYGTRDHQTLSWNGRMSEVVAALANEQLKAFPDMLKQIKENVSFFETEIKNSRTFSIVKNTYASQSSFSQLVLKIDTGAAKKSEIIEKLNGEKIAWWHANFEPIPSLAFFSGQNWERWVPMENRPGAASNYRYNFQGANEVYKNAGLGLNRDYFLTRKGTRALIEKLKRLGL